MANYTADSRGKVIYRLPYIGMIIGSDLDYSLDYIGRRNYDARHVFLSLASCFYGAATLFRAIAYLGRFTLLVHVKYCLCRHRKLLRPDYRFDTRLETEHLGVYWERDFDKFVLCRFSILCELLLIIDPRLDKHADIQTPVTPGQAANTRGPFFNTLIVLDYSAYRNSSNK